MVLRTRANEEAGIPKPPFEKGNPDESSETQNYRATGLLPRGPMLAELPKEISLLTVFKGGPPTPVGPPLQFARQAWCESTGPVAFCGERTKISF